MDNEIILALDVSTKTGWALLRSMPTGFALLDYGKIDQIHTPEGEYPANFVKWAHLCFNKIVEVIERLRPDCISIEETSAGSKAIYTQKILEFLHFLLASFFVDRNLKVYYIKTEEWRRETGCLISKEEKKRNKEVRDYKKKNVTSLAYDKDGKRIGKITRKHVNIRRANEVFAEFLKEPFRKKDEDVADACLVGYCHHLRRLKANEQPI